MVAHAATSIKVKLQLHSFNMQQCLSDVLLIVGGGGGGIRFLHHEISNPILFNTPIGLVRARPSEALRWLVPAALKFSRCWWSAGEEIASLLRFVISARLPAGGAASSQMTRVESGMVATTAAATAANWKAYTQKCLCLVTLVWVRGSDILVESGGGNCCISKINK